MKPHIRVQLREATGGATPHWEDILYSKAHAVDALYPAVDAVLAKYKLPVWVTSAYAPAAGSGWSDEEERAGLNRIYRLILQKDSTIPAGLIDEIALLPIVEQARPGEIVSADLPPARAKAMGVETGRESRDAIYLDEAHQYSRGDGSVIVAVLDTGICLTHPELRRSLIQGRDFVDTIDGQAEFVGDFLGVDESPEEEVGHSLAGIIPGAGVGMPEGLAPDCRLLPVRVLRAMRQGAWARGSSITSTPA
jgi:thermitase